MKVLNWLTEHPPESAEAAFRAGSLTAAIVVVITLLNVVFI